MANDVFNNPSNDYVYPALSPCAGSGSDNFLEFIDDGIGVVSGSKILAKIDFSDIKIPVSAYSIETKILGEQEVTYIPGLTKGLTKRQMSFLMPNNLVSTNENLNPFFFGIDLSINYYDSFKYSFKNIEASANYGENINLEDALNLVLNNLGIKVSATYDPSTLTFTGTMAGYDFEISNVNLFLIDVSENSSSPFSHLANADEYLLDNDVSNNISYAKYPNGGMQGVIMKGIYPSVTPLAPYDKWLYINHVSEFVTIYEPEIIENFISDVSMFLGVGFDPSTIIGCGITEPSASISFDIPDSSSNIYDISVGPIGVVDVSGQIIDASIIFDVNLYDCTVSNSDVSVSYIFSGVYSDVSIYQSLLEIPLLLQGILFSSLLKGDSSLSLELDNTLIISDSSLSNIFINGSLINDSYLKDSSINILDPSSNYNIIDNSSVGDTSLMYTTILSSSLSSTWVYGSYANRSPLNSIQLWDSSVNKSIIEDSSLFNSYVEDVSIYGSYLNNVHSEIGEIGNSIIVNSEFSETFFGESSIGDSSISGGSIINNSSYISNSTILNSWTNTYRLTVNASLGLYEYVMNDDTLGIDASFNTVTIYNSEIWDSSINNAILIDCSIFRSYLVDVSLSGCTIYNSPLDPAFYVDSLDNNRIILIDPSINNVIELTYDTSTYYRKVRKKLEVGLNGCSTSSSMSAGDYLEWITDNNFWNKFGQLYIWTSAPDCNDCGYMKNLINGFYVYNPHPFNIKIEYMLFV